MTLDKRILEMIKSYMGKLVPKKVLTTMEEVEANTNETNLAAAKVVAELNNKLAGLPEWIQDASGKITGYKTPGGADTVFPFNSLEDLINCPIAYGCAIPSMGTYTYIKKGNQNISETEAGMRIVLIGSNWNGQAYSAYVEAFRDGIFFCNEGEYQYIRKVTAGSRIASITGNVNGFQTFFVIRLSD